MDTDGKTAEADIIKPVCEASFVKMKALWIAVPVALAMLGACVTYALSTSTDISTLKSSVAETRAKVDKLDVEINKKLDILIERSSDKR